MEVIIGAIILAIALHGIECQLKRIAVALLRTTFSSTPRWPLTTEPQG
jgi:hypothetical protein